MNPLPPFPFRFFFVLLIWAGLSWSANGQAVDNGILLGELSDSSEKQKVENAVVLLLNPTDSFIVKHTRTNGFGAYRFVELRQGNYLLWITHPKYADFSFEIKINAGEIVRKDLYVLPKATALKEFIVTQKKGAIVFKGDTIEYNADSFKTKAFATVEDLLKKLPGIQVDKDGKITAQGEKVEKVLVDGEEFFSDDPTVATRNLQAAAVEKVQVYDKESSQSQTTGISDGTKETVVNLKLKEEYKRGMFGKLKAAGGLPQRYENEAMVNAFKSKRKLSAYIIHSNTNRNSLDWDEQRTYGSMNGVVDENEGYSVYYSENDWEISNGNEGVPSNLLAGGRFSNKYMGEKHTITADITYGSQVRRGTSSTITRQLLSDSSYYNTQADSFVSNGIRNGFSFSYIYKIDSFSTLSLSMNTSILKISKTDSFISGSLNEDQVYINKNHRTNITNKTESRYNGELRYLRKFRKKDRQFVLLTNYTGSSSLQEGQLFSKNLFVQKRDSLIVDQYKDNQNTDGNTKITSSYTEPINKNLTLQVSYSYTNDKSSSTNNSYNSDGVSYRIKDYKYSNDYIFNIITQSPGVSLKYKQKKWTLKGGANVLANTYTRTNRTIDSTTHYQYNNFQRSVSYQYKFSQFNAINIKYNGYTRQPNIFQIQPLQNNLDPLNIYRGNEHLKPQITNSIAIDFNSYKMISDRSIYSSLSYNNERNTFTNFDSINDLGQRISQTINVLQGNYSFWGWLYYGAKVKKRNIRYHITSRPNINNRINYINGKQNKTLSTSFDVSPGITFEKDDKYMIEVQFGFDYNTSKASLNPDRKTRYWIQTHAIDMTFYLPRKWLFNSDFTANIRQKTSDFTGNSNMYIWNASIERKMFKKENFVLSFIVRDILNQNTGFNRSVYSNYYTQSQYNVIKRYWLVSILWNFNKTAKAPNNKEGEDVK